VAEVVSLRGTAVKIRRPWGVFFLALVTLGIYYLVWYYKIHHELRDYTGRDINPFVSLLAITIGAFIIVPPFVSTYRSFGRIRWAQEQAGTEEHISPGIGFALYLVALVLLPFELVYGQSHLNRAWRKARQQDERWALEERTVGAAR
jgi:hypothetical protein